MDRLLKIGFERIGCWKLQNDKITPEINKAHNVQNALYAFVIGSEIKYVGKTVQQLQKRLYGYVNPGGSQLTNIRVSAKIKNELAGGESVDIYAFADNGMHNYGGFHVNLAAGLEDNLINEIRPAWNGNGSAPRILDSLKDRNIESNNIQGNQFELILHKAYYNSGFFNVRVEYERFFGKDGEVIEILVGNQIITGKINRRANNNFTPRIMGGKQLKKYFNENYQLMDVLTLNILGPNKISITKNIFTR